MRELLESSFINVISEENLELRKEIARLNKIIDELEKYLEDKNSFFKINTMGYSYGVVKDILNKLKELKEEGKE